MQCKFLTQYIQSSFLLGSFSEDLPIALISVYNVESVEGKKRKKKERKKIVNDENQWPNYKLPTSGYRYLPART
jgi:hypothetical protein